MRDPGLSEAIRAAGGVSELARQIGISQPSVSNWIGFPPNGWSRSRPRPAWIVRCYGRISTANKRWPAISMKSMQRGRRNTRCSRRCWRARRMPALLSRLAQLRGDADAARSRACRARRGGRAPTSSASNANFFDLFIGLGRGELLPYGSYYLTGFLHERPLARLREDLATTRHRARGRQSQSPKIMRPSCARSCPASRAAGFRRRPAPTASCSRSIWRPGSGASSPIWSTPKLRISTGASERSAGCSWTSRRRLSRCRPEAAKDEQNQGGTAMKRTQSQSWAVATSCARSAPARGRGSDRAAPLARKAADTETNDEKRKARYQANSAEVQTFYRVNRYPSEGEAPVLIKRTERQARRGTLAALGNQSDGGLDRRSFPAPLRPRRRRPRRARRAAACAACARPKPARRPAGAQVTIRKNICTHCSVGCTVIAEVSNGVWIGQEPGWDSPINRGSHCAKGAAVRELVHGDRRLKYPMKLVNGQWTRDLLGRRRSTRSATSSWRSARSRARIRSIGSARPSSPTKAPICSASSRRSGAPTTRTTRRVSAIRRRSPAWPIPGATAR